MKLGGIGAGENPFLKKPLDEINNPDSLESKNGITDGSKINSPDQADKIKKPGMEEGAASNNGEMNPNAKLDKTHFTKEDDMQEINLEEFEDDFN